MEICQNPEIKLCFRDMARFMVYLPELCCYERLGHLDQVHYADLRLFAYNSVIVQVSR